MSVTQDQVRAWLEEDEGEETRTTVGAASYTDPDQYADDRRIAKEGNVPISVVQEDREEMRRRNQVEKVDYRKLARDHAAVRKFLESPENAQIAHDDIGNLIQFDSEANRDWWEVDSRTMEGWGDSYMIGMGKMYDEAMIGILEEQKMRSPELGDFMNPFEGASRAARYWGRKLMWDENEERLWNEALDEKIEAHKQNLEFAHSEVARLTPEDLTTMEQGLRGGATMAADMLVGLGATYATRGKINPTLGYLTGKTFLDSYGQAAVEGLDHDTAMRYGAIDASIEFATEKIPLGMLEKIFGEVGKGGIKTSIKKFMLAEVAGEQVATATQSMNAYLHDLDEQLAKANTFDDVLRIQGERQAVTFISTLVGGGGMAGAAKGVDYLANRERRAMVRSLQEAGKRVNSEQDQARLDNLFYLAQSAKTNERAADVYKEFVDTVAPDQKIYMDVEAIEDLDNVPDYIVTQLDGSNGTIEIPMSDFIRDFVNDEARLAMVRPYIKTREGLQTQVEMDENVSSEYIKNMLERANEAKETNEASKAIFDRVKDQLVATGRQGEATARLSAQLIPAMVTTQYESMRAEGKEVTLEQLYEDLNFRIAGPGTVRTEQAQYLEQEGLILEEGVAGFTTERVSNLIQEYGYPGDPARTKAAVAYVNPIQFIQATAIDPNRILEETGPLDQQRLAGEMQTPFIEVEAGPQGWRIVGHEGRHRLMALANAGVEQVPIVVKTYQGRPGQEFTEIDQAEAQTFDWSGPVGQDLGLQAVTPLTYGNRQEVADMFGQGDILYQEGGYLAQQNFGDLTLTVNAIDEAENAVSLEIPAQEMWDEQQQRLNMVEQLRDCLIG